MAIRIVEGNLLDSEAAILAHQTNCCKGFGSGVARAVRDKYPHVAEEHWRLCDKNEKQGNPTSELLGTVQEVKVGDNKYIANLYAQDWFGYDGARYTSYDALDTCLLRLRQFCDKNNIKSVAFPYGMSSVRGGASWDVVMAMINHHFGNSDIDVEIRQLDLG